MKRVTKVIAIVLTAALMLTGCSNKGIHMSKHRKSRKCNCPTFSEKVRQDMRNNIFYPTTIETTITNDEEKTFIHLS